MSHALDESLQPLWSCIDMGIIAPPLGTTSAFCSRALPITVSFYGIRIIHCNARGKHSPFCCLFVRYTAGKVFPKSDGDVCWMICHSDETLIC